MHRIWLFFPFCKFQTISDKMLWQFSKLCLKFRLFPYTMLRTHNLAWRNFCSLLLNIVKKEKKIETNHCSNSVFSHDFCHWLSEKIRKIKCTILHFLVVHQIESLSNYPLRHNFAMVTSKPLFEIMKKLFGLVRFNKCFFLDLDFANFCQR